jgi:hypothetical protein
VLGGTGYVYQTGWVPNGMGSERDMCIKRDGFRTGL